MSSWAKSSAAARRQAANPNGSSQQLRLFRRATPYSREERGEELKDALDSYEELEQIQNYSGNVKYEGYKHQQNAKPSKAAKADGCTPADRRKALYQKFYRQVQEDKMPADCVVLSVTNRCMDYPKSLSQCLQERGLSVEMLYLQAESGLTRALQDVRAVGSPLCILVEHTNVALSSCTVIIFSESLKIHRNMPKDQAMDFVTAEYSHGLVKERPGRDPAETAAQASQLLDDFLEREKIEHHTVPLETRQLLLLLADGVHLYHEELETISEYVRSRQEHAQGGRLNKLVFVLLPTLRGRGVTCCLQVWGNPLLCSPLHRGCFNPLLSRSRAHDEPLSHSSVAFTRGLIFTRPAVFTQSRWPLCPSRAPLHHVPPYHQGPRGPHMGRGAPPSLKSSRPPLLASPGGPLQRPGGPRH
ncbi:hypothetical protein F7725_022493 [Dissostichus mawsoni]|uniref:Nuclear receptor coactivator 5 n=1 Tax=Dissostichus mawsoni TaxID=36200 RepID=A0A7J5Z2A9_DISMA|nr:hypothetical protein F7725_022493 [Dissostichus mawsoni]